MKKPSEYLECGLKLSLPANFSRTLDRSAETVLLEKGCTVLYQGEEPGFIYFIAEGLMRGYYIDSEGNDMSKCFAAEGEFACTERLRKSGKATFTIETLETCICVKIPYSFLNANRNEDETILKVINEFTQRALKKAERRERGLLTLSASERYIDFLLEESKLAGRLSQKHLSSYLGIRPGSLCRIKKQMDSPM